jgi:hypothetical protein
LSDALPIGDGTGFKQGRDFGAWLGLVPKQESTGDRTIPGKISTLCAAWALQPLAATLGIDFFIVLDRHYAPAHCVDRSHCPLRPRDAGLVRVRMDTSQPRHHGQAHDLPQNTPLHAKVEQMLTEARVLIPGAQARPSC